MMKRVIVLGVVLFCLYTGISTAEEKEVLIQKFLIDPVYIYHSADEFEIVPREALPDPGKTRVVVENYDYPTNMVMFLHQGLEMWVHVSELKLSETAVASVICTKPQPKAPTQNDGPGTDNKKIYTTMGLGEGCK